MGDSHLFRIPPGLVIFFSMSRLSTPIASPATRSTKQPSSSLGNYLQNLSPTRPQEARYFLRFSVVQVSKVHADQPVAALCLFRRTAAKARPSCHFEEPGRHGHQDT